MNDFQLTNDTKATILLCGVFGKTTKTKPLTLSEYNKIVDWLIETKNRPEDLFHEDNMHEASKHSGIDTTRIIALLNKGIELGFAVEEWNRNGIWVISRSDQDYPLRLKRRLKQNTPPILYGVGDRKMLLGGGLAIVGSRNIDSEGEKFTRNVAKLCSKNRIPVISGGARGVDQTAMYTSLEIGGYAIGVLAENLLKESISRKARQAISEKRLLLISPYHPSAGFTVGTAMARNKLIYAMADFGLVVSAEYKKGGTWTGAEEELKKESSIPIFVRTGANCPHGNNELIKIGANEWPLVSDEGNLAQELANNVSTTFVQKEAKILNIFELLDKEET